MRIKIQHTRTYWMQQKWFYERSSLSQSNQEKKKRDQTINEKGNITTYTKRFKESNDGWVRKI